MNFIGLPTIFGNIIFQLPVIPFPPSSKIAVKRPAFHQIFRAKSILSSVTGLDMQVLVQFQVMLAS